MKVKKWKKEIRTRFSKSVLEEVLLLTLLQLIGA
jgi:hypothetical protein